MSTFLAEIRDSLFGRSRPVVMYGVSSQRSFQVQDEEDARVVNSFLTMDCSSDPSDNCLFVPLSSQHFNSSMFPGLLYKVGD